MKVIVPPSIPALQDKGFPGSKTMDMKPKSARQARGGLSLDIRMFACSMVTSGGGVGIGTKNTDPLKVSMYETGGMNVLQSLSCPMQLSMRFSYGSGKRVKERTSCNLLTGFFLMYSIMFPCSIHSETVINCLFSIFPYTPTRLKTCGWDIVLQSTTSLQNCWKLFSPPRNCTRRYRWCSPFLFSGGHLFPQLSKSSPQRGAPYTSRT